MVLLLKDRVASILGGPVPFRVKICTFLPGVDLVSAFPSPFSLSFPEASVRQHGNVLASV